MSQLAITEIEGEENTAWFYRTEFLNYGIVYPNFFCPFCNIRLSPCNIDKEEKVVRSPYFKHYPNQNHLNGCDGKPIITNSDSNQKPKSKYKEMPIDSFPEALVARRPARQVNILTQAKTPTRILTPDEIQNQRKKIGNRGRNIPSSSLLKPFVDARNSVLHDSYAKFKEKGQAQAHQTWVADILSDMPLCLDDQTNYADAFRTPKSVNLYKKRIYHSTGKISLEHGNFIILGTEYIKKYQKNIEARLLIDVSKVNESSPQAHKRMLEQLYELVSVNANISWYIFGKAIQDNDKNFFLNTDNFDHIYIKKQYDKIQ